MFKISGQHLWEYLGSSAAGVPQLQRYKRDWVIPTRTLKENFDYSTAGYVAKIRSDWDEERTLYYTLLGHGASKEPVNLFIVEENTGLVRIRGTLDREERETYILTGVARFNNGTVAEGKIDLRFDVEDENDNPPVFVPVPPATIKESSPAGTLVGMLTATDADKANCSHSQIAYSIKKQEPSDGTDLFYIDRNTGSIYVKENTLDRETQSSYILTITGSDLNGAPGGNTGTGTIHIKVVDINDNVPTLEKDQYSGSIVENSAHVEVMRFKVLDADEEKTDNWLAVFDIVTGNEEGTFSIKTDPNTNEGVLMLEKPVDFEANPDISLGVAVSNVAPSVGGGGSDGGNQGEGDGEGQGVGAGEGGGDGEGGGEGAGGGDGGTAADLSAGAGGAGAAGAAGAGPGGSAKKPSTKKRPRKGKLYPVSIAVLNEPEGVTFQPSVKPVSVSENPEENPLMEVIAVYAATDTDTGEPAENVRYAKGYDPDNWLLIDSETAEIRLQKAPDRESPFLVNGTYYAKILGLTQDMPPKMVTGTVALQVGDVNDNCPTLTNAVKYICSDTEVVDVTAVDEDGEPNSAPFSFSLVAEKSQGEWRVEPLNDTSASLRALRPLWPGHCQVAFIIQDQQGLACPDPQYLDLHVCSCEEGETCKAAGAGGRGAFHKESLSSFGWLGVGTLILGLLILLSLLMLTCSCGEVSGIFSELPFDTRESLIVYHTEGRGEDKDVPQPTSPVQMTPAATIPAIQASNTVSKTRANTTTSFMTLNTANNTYKSRPEAAVKIQESCFEGSMESQRERYSVDQHLLQYQSMDGISLPDVFLHQYYSQSASRAGEKQSAQDGLLVYDYEGQGSSASSVGCCSLLESNDDLQFLDDLAPKFKILADICSPPRRPTPLTPKKIVIPQVDNIDYIVGPSLETKPSSIHGRSPECSQSVSQSSTSLTGLNETFTSSMHRQTPTSLSGFDGATFNNMHGQSSHITTNITQSPPVSPVSTAMLPSPGLTLLLQQQPVYYTTTPVLQPMHYVVQPQLQSTVLLAEAPVTNRQGMILQNGSSEHSEHMLQGADTHGTLTLSRTRGDRQQCNTETLMGGHISSRGQRGPHSVQSRQEKYQVDSITFHVLE
ncbi:desmoglein-3 [Lates calcarifer]|uniref:Desmoglein-3 n=1 Tax=Lates calcarifer TaxID=8187 RepID=A0AAJ8DMC4_LATCA|nr:desmoglein-3 [Lates calcarifer]